MDSWEGPSRFPVGFPTAGPPPKAALPAAMGTVTPNKTTLKKALLDVLVFRVFCEALNKENCRSSTEYKGENHQNMA